MNNIEKHINKNHSFELTKTTFEYNEVHDIESFRKGIDNYFNNHHPSMELDFEFENKDYSFNVRLTSNGYESSVCVQIDSSIKAEINTSSEFFKWFDENIDLLIEEYSS